MTRAKSQKNKRKRKMLLVLLWNEKNWKRRWGINWRKFRNPKRFWRNLRRRTFKNSSFDFFFFFFCFSDVPGRKRTISEARERIGRRRRGRQPKKKKKRIKQKQTAKDWAFWGCCSCCDSSYYSSCHFLWYRCRSFL